jgi:hypothetical protein
MHLRCIEVKNQRNALCRRIRSVKSWLSRAEKNFDAADDMRGELNLLLAEAELQRLRETEGKESARRRHIIAAAAALAIALASWSAWYVLPRASRQNVAAEIAAKEMAKKEDARTKEAEKPAIAGLKGQLPAIGAFSEEEPAAQQALPVAAAAAKGGEPGFSESDLRGLARTAGKALRSNI